MQLDFHYDATFCAALLAGWPYEESLEIAWSAQFVDCCSRTLLSSLSAPRAAATTQLQIELADAGTDLLSRQDMTRIWASFHFLPQDLKAEPGRGSKLYREKYRLICGPNGALLSETVGLAKGKGTQAAGLAMHVLADTWAHRYFAGTPSLVINNTNYHFFELLHPEDREGRRIRFHHRPGAPDDPETGLYTGTVFQTRENSVMSLGHGRAGHLPDYSYARYRYLPAWGGYEEIRKDNPADYWNAFRQMIHALRYLRGELPEFSLNTYDPAAEPFEARISALLNVRRLSAEEDWKAFGEELCGRALPDFDEKAHHEEYLSAGAPEKDQTFLGRFFLAALAQKSMVTARIFQTGSLLAGISVDFQKKGFRGIRDFRRLLEAERGGDA